MLHLTSVCAEYQSQVVLNASTSRSTALLALSSTLSPASHGTVSAVPQPLHACGRALDTSLIVTNVLIG